MFEEASEGPGGPGAAETESAIQQFLRAALSPADFRRLEELLAAIEQQGETPLDEDGNPKDGALSFSAVREFLQDRLAYVRRH